MNTQAYVGSTFAIPKNSEKDCADWSVPDQDPYSRIKNGIPANLGEFPWQAQLITFEDGVKDHFCGGTLISSKHVLTAAHCFVNWITNMAIPKEEIKVITGRLSIYDYEPQQVTSKVAKIIIHPDYSGPFTLNNDIALLELVEPVPFNRNIKMACLPLRSKSITQIYAVLPL